MLRGGQRELLPIREGDTLAQTLWLESDVPPPALCSGLGSCGACRVRLGREGVVPQALAVEEKILGPAALEAGWRLACRHAATEGMVVMLDEAVPSPAAARPQQPSARSGAGAPPCWLGVDVGTTTVHWRAVDAQGATVGEGKALNPQMGAGSEVMSRLRMAATPEGRARLSRRIRTFVRAICDELPGEVREVCLAANTAMTTIFLDKDCTGLLAAPYHLPEAGGRLVQLPALPPIWLPPQPAPFVGGDVAAGMAWLLDEGTPFPFLLADMGTNGEFVLALSENCAWLASVPMGPALEGIGLTHGGVAGPGSLVDFTLSPQGLEARFWPWSEPLPDGLRPTISGTGYLALLALLVRHGLLTPEGLLVGPTGGRLTPLAARLLAQVEREDGGGWRLPLPHGLLLTPHDVEEVLKVKAAFSLAVSALLELSGLDAGALRRCVLAGALGEHIPRSALETLGFVPPGLGEVLVVAGNTALQGAVRLVTRPDLRERLQRWSQHCRVLPLTDAPNFSEIYMAHMRWNRHF